MTDRSVLVTGGTGWLGTRLVPVLLRRGDHVRVFAHSSDGARRFVAALGPLASSVDVRRGDVADRASLKDALEGVDTVFHLAAEKAVDRCEREPLTAVRTNVLGTMVLMELAQRAGVSRIVAASTDKASEPAGVLGITKLLMERILMSTTSEPPSAAVRFGGLLQSGDSVLERWRRSAADGYIEVTDPEMTRFAMTTDEAINLLIEGASREGREIIAKALPAYRLGDLASAFAAQHRARVVVVGARSGERTHEALVSRAEAPFARRDGDLFVITPDLLQAGTEPYSSVDAPRFGVDQLSPLVGLDTTDV